MAKVSILTFHFSHNVGAMLQAYGLVKAIESIGHKAEVIDYRPLSMRTACEGKLPRHPVRFLRTVLFRHRIRSFRKACLPLTRVYLNMEELKQHPPQTDCFVCGSDQVWNIKSPIRGYDPTFFLEFLGENGPRRVSYAASFGNGTDFGCYRERVCDLLSRFDKISVREATGQNMVQNLIGRTANHVLDPSFLTDYDPITPPPIIKPPYILSYCFRKTEMSELAIKSLQQTLDIPVVSIKVNFDNSKIVNPGPLQWLSLMKHASYVCTDSYHGTCFSLINHKQFVILPYEGGMSRLEDILQTVKLTNRLADNMDKLKSALKTSIDYKDTSEEIEKARELSFSYLRDALRI